MKDFFKKPLTVTWASICSGLVLFFLISISVLTDSYYTQDIKVGKFSRYLSKATLGPGRVKNTQEYCRFIVEEKNVEYRSLNNNCAGLNPGMPVRLIFQKQYSKFRWQKYYSFKTRLLIKTELI